MRITYDQNVDALYIRFKETTVTTKHLGEGIAADYDADGLLAGIEVLDAVERLGDPSVFKRVTLETLRPRPEGRTGTFKEKEHLSKRAAPRKAVELAGSGRSRSPVHK
ncbi:MAG: DUF2283 domain-containing protein [Candidatus Sulfotelmatobacter sp.]